MTKFTETKEIRQEKEYYRKKSLSMRLTPENVDYFLKYAQEYQTETFSQTFNSMIEKLRMYEPLEHVLYTGGAFKDKKVVKAKDTFLENKAPEEKRVLELPEMELPKDDDENNEGGVIIL